MDCCDYFLIIINELFYYLIFTQWSNAEYTHTYIHTYINIYIYIYIYIFIYI